MKRSAINMPEIQYIMEKLSKYYMRIIWFLNLTFYVELRLKKEKHP